MNLAGSKGSRLLLLRKFPKAPLWVGRRPGRPHDSTVDSFLPRLVYQDFLQTEFLTHQMLQNNILDQWFSKCGPWIHSSCLTWEFVQKANSWAPPQTFWMRHSGDPQSGFLKVLWVILRHADNGGPLYEIFKLNVVMNELICCCALWLLASEIPGISPGIEPGPHQRKHQVLITGLPGNLPGWDYIAFKKEVTVYPLGQQQNKPRSCPHFPEMIDNLLGWVISMAE